MSDEPKHAKLLASLRRLRNGSMGKRRRVSRTPLEPRLIQLRVWQADRLAHTYADMLSSPQYGPACRFFLAEIYAARDFTQRDHDAEHAYQVMKRFLPISMLQTLTLVLQLNGLTAELDQALLLALNDLMGSKNEITVPHYAEAYRLCDNFDERSRQIDLIVEVGRGVNRLVSFPFVGMVLRLARAPAQRAGWGELQRFLERGFAAFKQMEDGSDSFIGTIEQRERLILARIYESDPTPFTIDAKAAE